MSGRIFRGSRLRSGSALPSAQAPENSLILIVGRSHLDCRAPAEAAKRFFRRLLKGLQYVPRVLVTDKLRSYGVAQRELLPDVEHRQSRYLNNRAENSHRPTRRRERQMQRFKSPRQAQRFLSAHAVIYGHFHPRRHRMTARTYRFARTAAFRVWQQETCVRRSAACRVSAAWRRAAQRRRKARSGRLRCA
jgi:putative transposase